MQQFEINAEKRADRGKGASRRLRHAGKAPGIVYGGGKVPQSIAVSNNEMLLHLDHEAFYSHILTLKLDGTSERVVLKDLQRHPYRPVIMHVDLLRVDENKKLTMRVPLHFLNEGIAPGVKVDAGVISHLMTDVEISCLPKHLPEFIAVDLGEMKLGDTVHIGDLKLPEGVEFEGDAEQGVVSCHIPRVVVEEEAAAPVAAEATAAAPAATAAAAPAAAPAKPEAKK
jgi:large subunit ribosomal protein L25